MSAMDGHSQTNNTDSCEPDRIRDEGEASLWRRALLIRRTEQKLLDCVRKGEVRGTIHSCVGQEWVGIAVARAMEDGETIFSNHRGHGHFLARTGDLCGLVGEILGRSSGACGGFGGSQHLSTDGFFSNGVLGGMLPVAAGWAMAEKLAGTGRLTVIIMGDGAFGEGVVYETFNMISRWSLPVLIVVENNHIAQSTASQDVMAGTIEGRTRAFDLCYAKGESRRWRELQVVVDRAATQVRESRKPCLVEIETFRLEAHSRGDDTRDRTVVDRAWKLDPLNRLAAGEPKMHETLRSEIDAEIENALSKARAQPAPSSPRIDTGEDRAETLHWLAPDVENGRIADLLQQALRESLRDDARVILLGQDIEAPYGGAFKITGDLSCEFPGRVRNSPVSEAALIGIAAGLAMNGFRPITEIMFGDFLGLAFDQLLNHASKFPLMYNGGIKAPLIVRTPMGGRRGYGPTHSQSLEKHFLGIPGMRVVALNGRVSPRRIYRELLRPAEGPTLVIENKVLYTRPLRHSAPLGFGVEMSSHPMPWVRVFPLEHQAQATVLCYGEMLDEAEDAIDRAFENDLLVEILCPTMLYPFDSRPLQESVARTGRLLTVEEGGTFAGLGAEAISRLSQAGIHPAVCRLGWDGMIPSSFELENRCLPNSQTIVQALMRLCHGA